MGDGDETAQIVNKTVGSNRQQHEIIVGSQNIGSPLLYQIGSRGQNPLHIFRHRGDWRGMPPVALFRSGKLACWARLGERTYRDDDFLRGLWEYPWGFEPPLGAMAQRMPGNEDKWGTLQQDGVSNE